MFPKRVFPKTLSLFLTAALPLTVTVGYAEPSEPQNGRPNPYRAIHGWAKLPEGRNWGSTAGIDIDPMNYVRFGDG